MSSDNSTLFAVAIGGAFTLLGAIVGSSSNLLIQWMQQRWQYRNDRRHDLHTKRLVALQNCVQLADFLIAAKGTSLAESGIDMWLSIRRENISKGIFFPASLQHDFKNAIRKTLMMDDLSQATADIDVAALERLRAECVTYIEREYNRGLSGLRTILPCPREAAQYFILDRTPCIRFWFCG